MIDIYKYVDLDNVNTHYLDRYVNFLKSIYVLGDRQLEYCERHHIIPRCVNSKLVYNKNNIIILTAREHFIAHLILTKCFTDNKKYKMYFAFNFMCNGKNNYIQRSFKISSKIYEYNKRISSKAAKRYNNGSRNFKGKHHSEETRKQMSEIKRKAKENGTWKNNFPNTKGENNPMYGKHHSEETKCKISKSCKRFYYS